MIFVWKINPVSIGIHEVFDTRVSHPIMTPYKSCRSHRPSNLRYLTEKKQTDFIVWSVCGLSFKCFIKLPSVSSTSPTVHWQMRGGLLFYRQLIYFIFPSKSAAFFFWSSAESSSGISVHPAVTDPVPARCAPRSCECAFWHFKKPCGGNVKSPRVRVCSPSCSLGRQCVPCHCASKHTQLPRVAISLRPCSPIHPSPPPPPQSLSDKVAGRLALSSCQYLQCTMRWHCCGRPRPAEEAGPCINQM